MAVLTLGDILTQCRHLIGGRPEDELLTHALTAAANTAHTETLLGALALGLDWLHRRDVQMAFTATTTSIILPDGVTVTDANGAIPVNCHIVSRVQEVDTGRILTPRPRTVVEMETGGLSIQSRGTPEYWQQSGVNSSGQRLLWIMPYPAYAGRVAIDYYGGIVPLTSVTQTLAVPVDFREVVCQRTISRVMSRVTNDPTAAREAKQTAERMWRDCVAASLGGKPEFASMTGILGQTN